MDCRGTRADGAVFRAGCDAYADARRVRSRVLLVAGAIFPVLLLGASFAGAYEDYDVMDSVIAAPKRRFAAGRAAARVPVVALSLVLFAAYVVAIAWWLVQVDCVVLVEQLPDTATPALGYILVGLRALPTDILLSLIDWFTGGDTVVVFGASSGAHAYYFLSMTVGWGVLVGLAAVAIQHLWQLRRVVAELSAGDERQRDLMERASRAVVCPARDPARGNRVG